MDDIETFYEKIILKHKKVILNKKLYKVNQVFTFYSRYCVRLQI